jgi:hypothetical protein
MYLTNYHTIKGSLMQYGRSRDRLCLAWKAPDMKVFVTEKKSLISCFGVHVTDSNTHNLSTRTGNFMRKSVIITGFLIDDDDDDDDVTAVNGVHGD